MRPVDERGDQRGSPQWIWAALVALALVIVTAGAIVGMVTTDDDQGDAAASRRHLLDALETAPHYKPAQALLLQTIEERQ